MFAAIDFRECVCVQMRPVCQCDERQDFVLLSTSLIHDSMSLMLLSLQSFRNSLSFG